MRLSIKSLLFLLFICNTFFSNLALAQRAEPLCPIRIYETGLYLGWGSALLEYTQDREAPSPFDRVIVEQLQGAHNLVERAALECEPAIPAWPSWKQKQAFLLNQIEELQKIYNHQYARQKVYDRINNTYNSWGSELSIMEFNGRTVYTTTCSTCYFHLGFTTAYAAQAFRQGDEALKYNNINGVKMQLKNAAGYLNRTLKVLEDYEDVQKPRGSIIIRCCNLDPLNLKSRIISLINDSKYVNNVSNCIIQANSIISDLQEELKTGSKFRRDKNSYEDCVKKHCPECDNQMVFLEKAFDKDCQDCLDKKKDLIAKCMDNEYSPDFEPEPYPSDIKCPLKNIDTRNLTLDNPTNKIKLKCTYSSNGLLTSQNSEINGIKNGENSTYKFIRNIHYISQITSFTNGRKDGVWKTYHYPNSTGEIVLASLIEYKNDVKLLEEFYDTRDFLSKRIKYVNGKKSEVTTFYKNGNASSQRTYNSDGTSLTYKAWFEDGSVK